MAVQISILVDDGQKVQVIEAGGDVTEALIQIVSRWKQQAAEPCPAGQKCNVLKQWIAEIESLLMGK